MNITKKYFISLSFLLLTSNLYAEKHSVYDFLPFTSNNKNVEVKKSSFDNLKNWKDSNFLPSFYAFKKSCNKIISDDNKLYISWFSICQKTLSEKIENSLTAKTFFKKNFSPYKIEFNNKNNGLFTGYYEPVIKGSLVKTDEYNIPIYKTPLNLTTKEFNGKIKFGMIDSSGKFKPYFTRKQIVENNILSKNDVIAWVKSRIDRTFLQIQGSGRIITKDKDILVGYDSQNGHPYRPIGRIILQKKYIPRKDISMQSIKQWLNEHPSLSNNVLNYDPSFVFFKKLNVNNPLGNQGIELTPGYSLAIDTNYYLYGTPIWLQTTYKDIKGRINNFDRLMIAQDKGGAINGAIRGDIFWGNGIDAEYNAGHMKNKGEIWVLLPKNNIKTVKK